MSAPSHLPTPTTFTDLKRPSQTFTDLSAPFTVQVIFPSEDESAGYVAIGWRTHAYNEFQERAVAGLLWSYLTDSAASPLTEAFVESEDAVCSGVYPSANTYAQGNNFISNV